MADTSVFCCNYTSFIILIFNDVFYHVLLAVNVKGADGFKKFI